MGYGVIGSPADSGSASLGSSPGTPAQLSPWRGSCWKKQHVLVPSSSGLGRRPLKAVARVRIPSGLHRERPASIDAGLFLFFGTPHPSPTTIHPVSWRPRDAGGTPGRTAPAGLIRPSRDQERQLRPAQPAVGASWNRIGSDVWRWRSGTPAVSRRSASFRAGVGRCERRPAGCAVVLVTPAEVGGYPISAAGGVLIEFSPPPHVGGERKVLVPSSSGLGRRPLKAVARVRIPSGLPEKIGPHR
jgi:hypothetical protein